MKRDINPTPPARSMFLTHNRTAFATACNSFASRYRYIMQQSVVTGRTPETEENLVNIGVKCLFCLFIAMVS